MYNRYKVKKASSTTKGRFTESRESSGAKSQLCACLGQTATVDISEGLHRSSLAAQDLGGIQCKGQDRSFLDSFGLLGHKHICKDAGEKNQSEKTPGVTQPILDSLILQQTCGILIHTATENGAPSLSELNLGLSSVRGEDG